MHLVKVGQALVSMAFEQGRGIMGTPFPKQPAKLLELYEFEACPYCRRVREALTALNLDYLSYPCPKNGTKYRPTAQALTGKAQFPLLVDPNLDVTIQDSQKIIEHLFSHYSPQSTTTVPQAFMPSTARTIAGTLGSLSSAMRGSRANSTNAKRPQPDAPLELYSFEASPFARLVRERLCELELPYIVRNVAKERWYEFGLAKMRLKPGKYVPLAGGKRERILKTVMNGTIQVPYLIDPNTQTQLFESKDIIAYLNQRYAHS